MKRYLCSLAIFAALALAPGAMAQDPYYGEGTYSQYPAGSAEARGHGYQHGYRDGFHHAREDMAAGVGANFRTRDYDRGDVGYESYMGDHDQYKMGFREGYERGYNDAFAGRRVAGEVYGVPRVYDDDDAYYRSRGTGDVYVQRHYAMGDVAYDTGYNDGIYYAQRDLARGHHFDPQGAKGFKDADHGYHDSYGDK